MKTLLAVALALGAICAAPVASAQHANGVRYSYSYSYSYQYQYQQSWRAAPRDFFRDRGCCLGRHHNFFRDTGRYHWPGDVYRGREPRYHVPPGYRVPGHRSVLRVHAQYVAMQARVVRR